MLFSCIKNRRALGFVLLKLLSKTIDRILIIVLEFQTETYENQITWFWFVSLFQNFILLSRERHNDKYESDILYAKIWRKNEFPSKWYTLLWSARHKIRSTQTKCQKPKLYMKLQYFYCKDEQLLHSTLNNILQINTTIFYYLKLKSKDNSWMCIDNSWMCGWRKKTWNNYSLVG